MRELPEDDRPSGVGMVPDTEEAAVADAGDLADLRNPMATAFAFVGSLLHDDGPDVESLQKLCTPESWEAFGDFTAARDSIGDRGLATRADAPSTGEPGVRYAKMVHMNDPDHEAERADGWVSINDARIITLQWRPADGYWRVHAFGMPVLPEDLPPAR